MEISKPTFSAASVALTGASSTSSSASVSEMEVNCPSKYLGVEKTMLITHVESAKTKDFRYRKCASINL